MKLLLTLSLLCLSSMALACPDFSGTYYLNEEESKQVKIVQIGCETITSIFSTNTLVLIIDGKYHETYSGLVSSDDGTVLGKVVISELGNFGTTELFYDVKTHVEFVNGSTLQDKVEKSVMTINAEGDLESVMTKEDGTFERSILKRIK